jgi:ribonuclease P protein component
VGNAVVRNRLKRRLREIFRAHQQLFPGDADLVVTLQPKAANATFADLEKQFLAAARRFGFGAGTKTTGSAPSAEGTDKRMDEKRASPSQATRANPGE